MASLETGKIQRILINKDIPGTAILTVTSVTEPAKADCVSGWEWVIDLKTVSGKAQYSLALAMYMADKSIVIQGHDLCDVNLNANSEVVRYIYPE